jgi:hypothetical protein
MTSLFLSLRESINVVIMIGSSRLRSHYVIPEKQIQKSEGQVAYMVSSLLRNSVRSGAYEESSSCRSGSTLILRNIIACLPSRECGCASAGVHFRAFPFLFSCFSLVGGFLTTGRTLMQGRSRRPTLYHKIIHAPCWSKVPNPTVLSPCRNICEECGPVGRCGNTGR